MKYTIVEVSLLNLAQVDPQQNLFCCSTSDKTSPCVERGKKPECSEAALRPAAFALGVMHGTRAKE